MPLDELLALYGYEASDPVSERESEGSGSTANLPDMTLDKVSGRAGLGGQVRAALGWGGGRAEWRPARRRRGRLCSPGPMGQGTVGRASSPQGKATCSVGRAATLVPSPQG